MSQNENIMLKLSENRYADVITKSEVIYDTLRLMGVKSAAEVVNPQFAKTGLGDPFAGNIKLSSTGPEILSATTLITGVIEKITPYVKTEMLRTLFPENNYPSQRLLLDQFDEIRGMTHSVAMGDPFPNIKKRGIETKSYIPPSAGEQLQISVQEALFLRDPGNQDISLRGLAMYMAKWSEQLGNRADVKYATDIYQALFEGTYTWQDQAISYGLDPNLQLSFDTLFGQPLGTITNDNIEPNAAANPILYLSVIRNQILKKYRGFKLKMVMNPNTEALFCQNPVFIQRIPFLYSNPAMITKATRDGANSMENLLNLTFGADLDYEVVVDSSSYIADENDPYGRTAGETYYTLPDYKVWFYFDRGRFGGTIGEYAYTLAVQNGGIQNPQPGRFMGIVNEQLSNTIQGMTNPSLYMYLGWNGGVRFQASQDVITLDVGPAA